MKTLGQIWFGEYYGGFAGIMQNTSEKVGVWIDFNNVKRYRDEIIIQMLRERRHLNIADAEQIFDEIVNA